MSSDSTSEHKRNRASGEEASGKASAIDSQPVLYVIRGPPGSGKSTVASELCQTLRDRGLSVAYLEQDHFRGGIMGNFGCKAEIYGPILVGAARSAIENGIHVVVEGMFTYPKSEQIMEGLSALRSCKLVYLSVDIEESLRRHAGREKAKTVAAEDIVKWAKLCGPTGLPNEVTIINNDKTETISKILAL